MATVNAQHRSAAQLAEENLPIARMVALRLKGRYPWVSAEDLQGYSHWGLVLAANAYSPDKGVPFPAFAVRKAMFLAIDQMRKEKVFRRAPAAGWKPWPRHHPLTVDIPDERSSRPTDALDTKDFVRLAMRCLAAKERQLLLMYYADGLTLREIGCVLHLSQSGVCLRHQALITRLRQAAGKSRTRLQGGTPC